jgi:hypothetical protein
MIITTVKLYPELLMWPDDSFTLESICPKDFTETPKTPIFRGFPYIGPEVDYRTVQCNL